MLNDGVYALPACGHINGGQLRVAGPDVAPATTPREVSSHSIC
jgi:hypothetical protein